MNNLDRLTLTIAHAHGRIAKCNFMLGLLRSCEVPVGIKHDEEYYRALRAFWMKVRDDDELEWDLEVKRLAQ